MKISEAMKEGILELKDNNIEEPGLLMKYVLDETRKYVTVNDMEEMSKELEDKYSTLVNVLIDILKIKIPPNSCF